jgi:hypothetical protein
MWLASKTPDEESQTISYLWRIEPFTDRRGGGKPTSIEKYARIIDPIVVRDEHGSGNYRLDVCHIPKNGGASTRQRQIYFNVMHPDYPPKIPYGEWINDPANERWKWAEPKLRETAGDIHGTNGANGQVPNPQGMFSTILEGVRTLRGDTSESSGLATAVIDMVRDNQDEMRKLSNPATQLGALKELLAVIQPKPSEEGGGLKYVVDLLMKQNDRLADELKESRIAAAAQAKPRNFLEEVREFLPALKEINSSLGMGPKSSNGHTDWGSITFQSSHRPICSQCSTKPQQRRTERPRPNRKPESCRLAPAMERSRPPKHRPAPPGSRHRMVRRWMYQPSRSKRSKTGCKRYSTNTAR